MHVLCQNASWKNFLYRNSSSLDISHVSKKCYDSPFECCYQRNLRAQVSQSIHGLEGILSCENYEPHRQKGPESVLGADLSIHAKCENTFWIHLQLFNKINSVILLLHSNNWAVNNLTPISCFFRTWLKASALKQPPEHFSYLYFSTTWDWSYLARNRQYLRVKHYWSVHAYSAVRVACGEP